MVPLIPTFFCNFGGDDSIRSIGEGDIFLGGEGNELIHDISSGATFYGGEGNDSLDFNSGTFYGGPGDDTVSRGTLPVDGL
jgi:hypothetical protein